MCYHWKLKLKATATSKYGLPSPTFLYLMIACAFLTPIPQSWAKSCKVAALMSTFLLAMVPRTTGLDIYNDRLWSYPSHSYQYSSMLEVNCKILLTGRSVFIRRVGTITEALTCGSTISSPSPPKEER